MAYSNYKELIVWQRSMDLADEIYKLVKKLPPDERFVLSDQMRRAAISIPSNIAEGHGRHTANEFKNFLSIANGSCLELETQLLLCVRQRYFSENEAETALSLSNEVGRMLAALIVKLQSEKLKTEN